MLPLIDWPFSRLRRLTALSATAALALSALLPAGFVVLAPAPLIAAQSIDPSDVWFRAYLLMKEGEQMEEQTDLLGAYNKYVESKQLLDAVYHEHPEFHPGIVRFRRKFLADKITELRAAMKKANSVANGPVTGETQVSPGGVELPGRTQQPPVGSSPEFPAPLQPVGDPSIISPPQPGGSIVPADPNNPFAGLQQQYQQMKAEVDRLNQVNSSLQQQLAERQRQLDAYQGELQQAREREKALREQMQQNGASPETVNALKQQLAEAMQLAKEANDRSDSLLAELETSRSESALLKKERDRILRERDQLAAVIDQDAGKQQLAMLVKENERLRSELDETRELAETLRKESGDKDAELIILKDKLASIERERTQLLQDNALHQRHIAELQQHLKNLGKADLAGPSVEIASLDADASKAMEENGLLRDIVLRQLGRQNQLKQAKEALIEQLEDLGVESASLLASIDDIVAGATMTAEERDMIRQPDITDPSTGPMETTIIVQGAEADGSGQGIVSVQSVTEELQQIQKAARLDYAEGRLEEARIGYEKYLRLQPQNVEGTCNLALVHLRLESFEAARMLLEKASAYDGEASRPHFLLGVMFFRQGKMDEALGELELGIERNPENARAHNYVGVISSQKGWSKRAEESFAQAATLDPKFADPHFNLAVLYATGDEPDAEKARKHYAQALELGAERDHAIEQFLDASAQAGAVTTASTF